MTSAVARLPAPRSPRAVVMALGTAQAVGWASSFYLPTLLAEPMARDLGTTPPTVFAALSAALLIGALVSPWAGRRIDIGDGRAMLLRAWVLFVAGLGMLAAAQGLGTLLLAWTLLGLAMGCGLYDAAFATLVRLYGPAARRAISGITLIAGFASTVGWPLTAWMEAHAGWRGAVLGWIALQVLVALPLLLSLPDAPDATPGAAPPAAGAAAADPAAPPPRRGQLVLVALLFVCLGFVSTSVATHLPALLMALGVPLAGAVALAALAGPAQVTARLAELGLLSRFSPLLAARLAAAGHPAAVVAALLLGPAGALPFVLLHGLGNGLLTIVRGTLPLALFGSAGYGARQGVIALPGRLVGAASPFLLGWVLEHHGRAALGLTAVLGVVALLILALLRVDNQGRR
ncbi:MAG: MFS transporter [Betaproteobacteria bacterium]|jgi:predicted MFS family arabinose efflux permease|nr:MFS transporter [Rubrivivax sp.]